MVRQVVTELDSMIAVYDYLAEQLDDRLRYEYPDENVAEAIDDLIDDLRNPLNRTSVPCMKMMLVNTVNQYTEALTICEISGCEGNHDFIRDFIRLVWNAHKGTAEWLRGQGVVVGQSAN